MERSFLATISFWPGEAQGQLLGHLDPGGRDQQRQHRLPCPLLPGRDLQLFSRIFIFNWFQTISDTANTFQVYLTWHLKTSTICFRCIYSDIRSYHNLIFLWFWYIHLRVNWAQQLFRPEAYVHLLSFTGLFKKSAQSDSTLILNTEVRFCPENFGLNSGEIYSDPGRNSSDTQEGN